jgi:hypothetical protein
MTKAEEILKTIQEVAESIYNNRGSLPTKFISKAEFEYRMKHDKYFRESYISEEE